MWLQQKCFFWRVFLHLLCIESRLQDVGATFWFTEPSEWVFSGGFLSALVFVFVGGEAFVRACVCVCAHSV